MSVKSTLKTVKLNESLISMILGAIVIIAAGLLIVNFFKKNNTSPSLSTGEINQGTENQNTSGNKTYTVKEGDNLWKISQAMYNDGYKWTEIAKSNNLKSANDINVGQELIIPDLGSQNLASNSEPTSTVTPTPTQVQPSETVTPTPTIQNEQTLSTSVSSVEPISGATYTVQKGDNLWKIAVRAYGDGYKWVDIANANHLQHPNLIHPGNTFTLPR